MKYGVKTTDGETTEIECEWIDTDNRWDKSGKWIRFLKQSENLTTKATLVALISADRVISVNIVE